MSFLLLLSGAAGLQTSSCLASRRNSCYSSLYGRAIRPRTRIAEANDSMEARAVGGGREIGTNEVDRTEVNPATMGTITEHYKALEEEQGLMQSRPPPFSAAELMNGRVAMVASAIFLAREFLWDGESIPQQVSEAFASIEQAAASWC